jgi:hypothetical protein
LALVLAAVWGVACSAPPAGPATVGVCLGRPTGEWASALGGKAIALPQGVAFGLSAVAEDVAFGQFTREGSSGVGAVDLRSGQMTPISTYASGVSGLGGLAVEEPWIVWEQLDSTSNLADWSVHAFNRATRAGRVLATSRLADGGYAAGQQPLPVLRHGIAAWAQPKRDGATALLAVDLASGREWTLDTGQVSSPVFAGPYLLWAKVDTGRAYSFHAVDEKTLQPAELPEPLRGPGSVGYLGGSAEYLVWSDQDSTTLESWEFHTGSRRTFTIADRRHFFQFLQVAGDFLVWFGGRTSSVLDLRTGNGFDIAGTVAGSGPWIAAAQPAAAGSAARISRISTTAAPRIATCTQPR